MAHFAELDSNNVVLRVIVVDNADCCDANGTEKESIGIAFCEKLLGGKWVQTSYNASIRSMFAGVGAIYDAERNIFRTARPDEQTTWIYHEEDNKWVRPVPIPDDWAWSPAEEALGKKTYVWDETANNWSAIQTVFT